MQNSPSGLAIKCTAKGIIEDVLRDDFGLLKHNNTEQAFIELLDKGSHTKGKKFLDLILSEDMAYHWQLNVPTDDDTLELFFTGVKDKRSILLLGVEYKENADLFYREIMRIADENSTKLRQELKKTIRLSESQDSQEDYEKFMALNNELVTLQRELAKKNHEIQVLNSELSHEFEKAKTIHYRLFSRELPRLQGYEIAVHYQPAYYLGGDFYHFARRDNKLIFFVSDITGHSLDATMMTNFLKEAFCSYINLMQKFNAPYSAKDIIDHIKRQYLEEHFPEDYFICVFVGILDLTNQKLEYSSLGFHAVPSMVTPQNKIHKLSVGGLPISNVVDRTLMEPINHYTHFNNNEMLFITTDGLLEEKAEQGIYNDYLDKKLLAVHQKSAKSIKEEILSDFYNKTKGSKSDDITFIILKKS